MSCLPQSVLGELAGWNLRHDFRFDLRVYVFDVGATAGGFDSSVD